MNFRWNYFVECIKEGIWYIPASLRLALISYAIAVVIAFGIATARHFRIPVLSQVLAFLNTVYMGIPAILALNVYYLLAVIVIDDLSGTLGMADMIKNFNFRLVAYLTVILQCSTILSEHFRGAYKAIDQVQFEAGYSIGLTKGQTLRRIIIPQMLPVVLPNMVNMLAGSIKNINLISAIGLMEVMGGSLIPCNRTYSFLEGYIAAAVIYWILVVVVEHVGKWLEKRIVRYRR